MLALAFNEISASRVVRRPAWTPSTLKANVVSGAPLFALNGGGAGAAEFGVEVHTLLADVEWAGDGPSEMLLAAAVGSAAAVEEAAECLRAAELSCVWARPVGAANAEVWRERAFEVVLDGAWITGVFDRVVIERDAVGVATRATVFDFKTDRVERGDDLAVAAARHVGQLDVYRHAVARLTSLPAAAVECAVVFTRVRQWVPV